MFDTIVTNLLVTGALVGLFVALPVWWVLRAAGRDDQRGGDGASDPSPQWIHAAAIMSVFGPFWYQPYNRPRLRAPEPIPPKEGDQA